MKTILARVWGWRKWAVLAACCAASYVVLWYGLINLLGEGYGIPLYRGHISLGWIEEKGALGYPLSLFVLLPALFSLFALCASTVGDAAKLAFANLAGIACLGLLAMSRDYIEPCTHDAVMVSAWIAGCVAVERSKGLRALLVLGLVPMVLWVGEVWHGLGGATWCPLRESERYLGELVMVCVGLACAVSVFGRILESRLGLERGLWKVRAIALALALLLFWGLFKIMRHFANLGTFDEDEMGLMFGVAVPLAASSLNAGLGLFALGRWMCGKLRR